MKTLADIIKDIPVKKISGDLTAQVSELCFDSRKAAAGKMFFAIKGTQADGHQFLKQVIEAGCTMLVVEDEHAILETPGISVIVAEDSSKALALAAGNFYDHPSTQLKLIGVTGTNGKTTVATLLHQLFSNLGYSCGLLSTVRNIIGKEALPATHTTPDAIAVHKLMRQMVDAGCTYAFMECSSHAIHQNRIHGLNFTGVIFTNITHDHLDYHGTFANYIAAKKKLFDELNSDAFALINKDDKNGKVMVQNSKASVYYYALKNFADFKVKIIEQDFEGMLLEISGKQLWVRLTGEFNAYNMTAVYAAAFLAGQDGDGLITAMSSLQPAEGRFDMLRSDNGITGIIDYAHTPDALENVLETINNIRTRNEQLITIIGCGGNRDKEKRPEMARIATEKSTRVILTSDNPRNEDPEEIIAEMYKGVAAPMVKKTLKITDRREAIRTAVMLAQKGDVILLAGKGHEHYQEIKGEKFPFSDKEELQKAFNV